MKRRAFLQGLAAALTGPCLLDALDRTECTASAMGTHSSGMNVLCIVVEDLTTEAVGCYGNPVVKTPCLDRLAKTATRFTRCYCQSPMCDMSGKAFLTGLRPGMTRGHDNADSGGQFPLKTKPLIPGLIHQYGIHTVNIGELFHHPGAVRQPCSGYTPDRDSKEDTAQSRAKHAAHLLGQLAEEKRQFFMTLSFSKPLTPLRCPDAYLDLHDLEDIAVPPAPPEQDSNIPAVAKHLGRNDAADEGPVTDEAARKAIQAYYGCMSLVDAQIGVVLDALDRENLNNDTIVIIFSNHGYHLGQHGLWGKRTLFEQSTRVPLFVRVPGRNVEGSVCDEIVELVDLPSTLCELLAIPSPEGLEGVSFLPLLSDPRQPWKLAAFTTCVVAGHIGRSVRTKRWRYTDWRSCETSLRQFELYDLNTDPWEQTNLVLDPACRTQRTILANLLQRGWSVAYQRGATESAHQVGLPQHRCRHILW